MSVRTFLSLRLKTQDYVSLRVDQPWAYKTETNWGRSLRGSKCLPGLTRLKQHQNNCIQRNIQVMWILSNIFGILQEGNLPSRISKGQCARYKKAAVSWNSTRTQELPVWQAKETHPRISGCNNEPGWQRGHFLKPRALQQLGYTPCDVSSIGL